MVTMNSAEGMILLIFSRQSAVQLIEGLTLSLSFLLKNESKTVLSIAK